MKVARLSNSYPKWITHEIGDMNVSVQIDQNPYQLPIESLYEMAARINKKRSFLFVSKVLGKHIPRSPQIPHIAGALLSALYYEKTTGNELMGKEKWIEALVEASEAPLQSAYTSVQALQLSMGEPLIFIGFAETATGLGHSVFDCFKDAVYMHSTREHLLEEEVTLYFEEEHSHAVDQRCYAPIHYLDNDNTIVLVDDEITTGKTALNIIASLQKRFPRKKYVILSLLDWRKQKDIEQIRAVERTYGIVIEVVSLVSGSIQVEGTPNLTEEGFSGISDGEIPDVNWIDVTQIPTPMQPYVYPSVDSTGQVNNEPYSAMTGRFGLESDQQSAIENYCKEVGHFLQGHRAEERTLCLGTGEFMYIPMKVSAHMGEDISYHSTTRSPIFPLTRTDYPIKTRTQFESPEDPSVMNYLYNVADNQYDEAFIFLERSHGLDRVKPLLRGLNTIQKLHVVRLG